MALGSDGVLGDGVDEDKDAPDVRIVDGGDGDSAAEGGVGSSYEGLGLGRIFVGCLSAGGAI